MSSLRGMPVITRWTRYGRGASGAKGLARAEYRGTARDARDGAPLCGVDRLMEDQPRQQHCNDAEGRGHNHGDVWRGAVCPGEKREISESVEQPLSADKRQPAYGHAQTVLAQQQYGKDEHQP